MLVDMLIAALVCMGASLAGQAIRQAGEPGKMPAAITLFLVFSAIPIALGVFLDKRITAIDLIAWAVAYVIGFFMGQRSKS